MTEKEAMVERSEDKREQEATKVADSKKPRSDKERQQDRDGK